MYDRLLSLHGGSIRRLAAAVAEFEHGAYGNGPMLPIEQQARIATEQMRFKLQAVLQATCGVYYPIWKFKARCYEHGASVGDRKDAKTGQIVNAEIEVDDLIFLIETTLTDGLAYPPRRAAHLTVHPLCPVCHEFLCIPYDASQGDQHRVRSLADVDRIILASSACTYCTNKAEREAARNDAPAGECGDVVNTPQSGDKPHIVTSPLVSGVQHGAATGLLEVAMS